MTKKAHRSHQKTEQSAALPSIDLPMQSAQVVVVEYLLHPPKATKPKTIHRRRYAPTIPEGAKIPDRTPSPAVAIQAATPGVQ